MSLVEGSYSDATPISVIVIEDNDQEKTKSSAQNENETSNSVTEMTVETSDQETNYTIVTDKPMDPQAAIVAITEVGDQINASNKPTDECIKCNVHAVHGLILEEKLSMSHTAYNETKKNLEVSDSKLAENCKMIDELNNSIKALKADADIAKSAEKDAKIR